MIRSLGFTDCGSLADWLMGAKQIPKGKNLLKFVNVLREALRRGERAAPPPPSIHARHARVPAVPPDTGADAASGTSSRCSDPP